MMDIQELVSRGRFAFANAPERLTVYTLVDGRRTADELAVHTKRHRNNIHRDLRRLNDLNLIRPREKKGKSVTKNGLVVYEKTPLARSIPITYFQGPVKLKTTNQVTKPSAKKARRRPLSLAMPSQNEILDLCKEGEDQTLEFKAGGTDIRKITKEITAMLNTRQGGMIFYGVSDDGVIHGSDVTRQKFDQPLQNSVKNSIKPSAPTITLKTVSVMGTEILVLIVPPWNRKDVYQFDEKVLMRKGTNVFAASPEELRKLYKGEYVI